MFKPDDPLKPRDPAFNEAWHAQTLALADTMVKAGHFTANDWASTLGGALKDADARGQPDNTETYYHCAISALEQLVASGTSIDPVMMSKRKATWERAYLATPHGQPVKLEAGEA
ncbi:MAG: nitrile hydratase accessory protein [Paracoccaceae bacterium]